MSSYPTVAAVLVCLVLSPGVAANNSGPIERVQMGDNELDCASIAAEVEQLDAILAPHSGDQGALRGATQSATRSRTGDVVAGVAKVLPFGSVFGDIAKDVLGRRGREAEARVTAARARKEYLVDMFLKRDCRLADLRPPPGKAPAGAAQEGAAAGRPADAPPPEAVPGAAVLSPPLPKAEPLEAPAPPLAQSAPTDGAAGRDTLAGKNGDQPAATPPVTAAEPPPAVPPATPRGPLFVLDFRLAFRTSADADGAAGAPGLELGGVPLKTMQALTDLAYTALLKDLAQAGYEVLNPEITAWSPGASGLPAPARAGDYLYFAPSGAPLAQAPKALQPGSDAALGETRAALARAVSGRKPGVSYGIGVWYVDFARIRDAAGKQPSRRLESRLSVAAGSHLAIVEPGAGDTTPAEAVRVLNLGQDLVTREPYGQVRLPAGTNTLQLQADPRRFTTLVERQLKRGRSALISSLPPAPVAGQ